MIDSLTNKWAWHLVIASRWLVAVVFLFAGIPKLLDINSFAKIIEAYGLVPEQLLIPVAILLAVAEVVCAVGLLLRKKAALYLISGLMIIFIMVLSYGVLVGLDIDCGCFSTNDPEHKAFSGLRTALVRDLLLLLPLSCLLWQEAQQKKIFYNKTEME